MLKILCSQSSSLSDVKKKKKDIETQDMAEALKFIFKGNSSHFKNSKSESKGSQNTLRRCL